MSFLLDKFNEECAIVGVWNVPDASKFCYLGLYSMQHRGQEGAGIISSDNGSFITHKGMGLVADVFNKENLNKLTGYSAIAHNRYATCGGSEMDNLQPFYKKINGEDLALAHNGNLINADEIKDRLRAKGVQFKSSSDSECFLHLADELDPKLTDLEKFQKISLQVRGAYSLVILNQTGLLALRDPSGVRPLSLGKLGNGYVVASETCCFDLLGAEFVRDIEPGEIIEISGGSDSAQSQIKSHRLDQVAPKALCIFEHVYFARPDSKINGQNVYMSRRALGRELAKEYPVEADLVIPVPDSGVPSSIGYSQQSGIPLELGLIRNHYVGRTFIEPSQEIRDFGVKIKLNANPSLLEGKRIIVVDDSIVRGTTSRKIIQMLRRAGAKEIHFRISSPPTVSPCYYGIDTPTKDELIASKMTLEEIRQFIEADSLGYLSIEGMYRAVNELENGKMSGFCDACFTNNYPLGIS